MRISACVLITAAACALADTNHNRRTKLPYIADAVGNSIPPPSSVPATVGSPVNLLTPDRYEFYTFDESGELVKRLMTLEEIQAIVAAGEESDGLVTFANDNQPTIAFNFSQPSHTKVHSVVTNVKNVLKAQMEAHKNKPNIQPTFDTPDVSDSWSLILPSIFGNTGADIVPDKVTNSFITPETETIEIENLNPDYQISQSKESNEIPTVSTSESNENKNGVFIESSTDNVLSSTTTTSMPLIGSTTQKLPPSTTKATTTTIKVSSSRTTSAPKYTTASAPKTQKPVSTTTTPSPTTKTIKYTPSSKTTTEKSNIRKDQNIYNSIQNNLSSSSSNKPMQYEKISTYTPTSTSEYVTEKLKTQNSVQTNQISTNLENVDIGSNNFPTSTVTYSSLSNKINEYEKTNSTTVTTQSVSPSIIVSSTELTSVYNIPLKNNEQINIRPLLENDNYKEESQTSLPLFDVAQSISQIASDLGNNFAPHPTSNSILDTTRISNLDIESKENVEIDIPTEPTNETNESEYEANQSNSDNFVKISTFDPEMKPHDNVEINSSKEVQTTSIPEATTINLSTTSSSIIDPILSVSMDDLLSQVVHANPEPTSIIFTENITTVDNMDITTDTTTKLPHDMSRHESTTTSGINNQISNISSIKNFEPAIIKEDKLPVNTNNTNENYTSTPTVNINSKLKTVTEPTNKSIVNTTPKNDEVYEEKKIILNPKSEISTKPPIVTTTENKLVSSTIKSVLSTEKNTIKLTLAEKITTQEVKSNTKHNKHKDTDDLPKLDEFKKKIQKVNIDDKELTTERNNSWKLIPTVSPPKAAEMNKDKHKVESFYTPESIDNKDIVLEFPKENQGLEVTTKNLGEDILQFTELCNELAFRYWQMLSENVDKKRTIVFSPYSITSMLAMMFMGARGGTSGEMNDVLKLDDMVTFNPHFTLKNISDSIETTSSSGVAVSAFIRELFSERHKGKILTFYKERAQHFYNGHVEEINFDLISDIIRRRTNLLVKRYTWGKIVEYMKRNSITLHPPLAAFSANIFETDCSGTSVEGRDGEIYFVVSPNVRQRRLVPVPAVVYKSNFLAGYDPDLDATAAALGNTNSIISTLFLMPGQQGNVVHADDLEKLEKRLLNTSTSSWNALLRTLLPRMGLELQIPRFSHKSIFNVSSTLRKMGLKELFDADHADLGGVNGPSKDLYLSDMVQLTTFATCGEGVIADQHHVEEYPDTLNAPHKRRNSRWLSGWDEPGDYQRAFHDPHDVGDAMHLPLHLRPRQARLPARNSQPARLKFDRPFLFFVRHNPSGMILYVGRYNPRLLP